MRLIQRGQTKIPAIVIDAEESDCLSCEFLSKLRETTASELIDLLQDIGTLRGFRGYGRSRNRRENRRSLALTILA